MGRSDKLKTSIILMAKVSRRPIDAAPWCGLKTSEKKVPKVVSPLIKTARCVAALKHGSVAG